MEKKWIDPTEIYVYEVLNNRDLNQNYIGDLAQSMLDKGFLPEFPIDVFKSENLANIDTDLPYICACGAHRTLGAINAKLDQVLVNIHNGREEDFIETMHLDNFKFDPAQHSGIGQPFTQKEKRSAVTQLLLLPKFFEQTNTALEERWRIPQSSLRRWRNEVMELLETDSPKLRLWGISDGRLARLRELAKNPERVDAEGKIVKIRKPLAEPTEAEKEAFYKVIEKDWYREPAALDTEFTHVATYLQDKYKTESKWRIYTELSMPQLQKLHSAILSKDPEFMSAVHKIAAAENRIDKARDGLRKACDACEKAFKRTLAKRVSEGSRIFTDMKDRLQRFLRKHDERFDGFHFTYYYYDTDLRDNPEFCETYTALHREVKEGLETGADWLSEFIEKEKARSARKQKKADQLWLSNQGHLKEAIVRYPRAISEDAIIAAAENKFNYELRHNELRSLIDAETPSPKKNFETIEKEAAIFEKVAKALNTDADWVQEIPVPKPLIEVLPEVVEAQKEAEQEAPVLQPEDLLQNLSLKEILRHVKDRVIYIPVEDESQVRMELAQVLGNASRGQTGTQLYLLMDYALFVCPKENREGVVIEKDGEEPPE